MLEACLKQCADGDILCLPQGIHPGGLLIQRNLHLLSAGAVLLSGRDDDTTLVVSGPVQVTLSGLTLRGGSAPSGAALLVTGGATLTLDACRIEGHSATHYGGGAFYVDDGTLILNRCVITGNSAKFFGGGGLVEGTGRLEAHATLWVGNRAPSGAALAAIDGAHIELNHCTLCAPPADHGFLVWGQSTRTRAPHIALRNTILDPPATMRAVGWETQLPRPHLSVHTSLIAACPSPPWPPDTAVNTRYERPRYCGDDPARGLSPSSPGRGMVTAPATADAPLDLAEQPICGPGLDPGAVVRSLS